MRDHDFERYERLHMNLQASVAAADAILAAHDGCNCELCREVHGIRYAVGLMDGALTCTLPEAV